MAASLTSILDSPLLEPTLLRAATRRARTLPDAARERMKPWVGMARARYRVALELRDHQSKAVALGLLRESAFFALCALKLADSESAPSPSAKAAWQRFTAQAQPSGAPPNASRAREALAEDDPLALEALSASDEGALRASAEQIVAWLLALAEVRTPRELNRARWLRTSFAALAVIVLAWAMLSYWSSLNALSAHAA